MTFDEIVGSYNDGIFSRAELVHRITDELPSDMPCNLHRHIEEFHATGDYLALARRIMANAGG